MTRVSTPRAAGATVRRRASGRAVVGAGLALLLVLFVGTGAVGQSWLHHWDEDALVNKVHWSIDHGGTLLPGTYDWPPAVYVVALAAFTPELVSGVEHSTSVAALTDRLDREADGPAYRLRLRRVFLIIAALTLVWIAVALLASGSAAPIALVGAALAGTSWTVAYHARWATPDALMIQFAALSLALLALALARRSQRLLWAAAAAAGAVVACKYSGWPLVACIMGSAAVAAPTPREAWQTACRVGVTSVLAFLVISPGAILQPYLFLAGLRYELVLYTTGHSIHTITAGLPHLGAELAALTLSMWSRSRLVSGVLALLAIPGALHVWRHTRALAVTAIGFPVVFVVYLGLHRVFMVRNLLPVVPFLAFLIAIGIAACWSAARRLPLRAVVVLLVAAVLVDNGWFLVRAAGSRRDPSRAVVLRQAAADAVTSGPVCATPAVVRDFASAGVILPAGLARSCRDAARVLFERSDVRHYAPPGTRWFERVYAPKEVDYVAYPDWTGYDPVLMGSIDQARALGVATP